MIAIQRATPLIFVSVGAVMAFQGGAINMGLDGQFTVGASIAAMAGYALPPMPGPLAVFIIFILCGLGGAAAAFIPAIFKRMSGVNEVITGMIANLIIPHLMSWITSSSGYLQEAAAGASREGIQTTAQLTQFSELTNGKVGTGTFANTGIFIAIIFTILLAYFFGRSKLGYEIRMTRLNFSLAEFAGIKAGKMFFLAMMLSGAIAAMAGSVEILGGWREYRTGTLAVGNQGILLSLVGGQNFIGAMIASLFYGGLQSGALNAQWVTNVPRPLMDILVQIIILFAAIPSMRMFFAGTSFADVDNLGGRFVSHR